MDMLERAVKAIRAGRAPDLDKPLRREPEVNLHCRRCIPTTICPTCTAA
jgi:transcription-repair coupling factor (superfamily II helicase)